MISPYEAWILRRILTGQPQNGELKTLSGDIALMAGHLAKIPLEQRQRAWEAQLALVKDRDGLIQSVMDADPLGPAPARPAASPLGASGRPDQEPGGRTVRLAQLDCEISLHAAVV